MVSLLNTEPATDKYGIGLHTGFIESVKKNPYAAALTLEKEDISYGELDYNARKWATAVIKGLNGMPNRIGIFAYRSLISYTSVLATLFTGATFVPLNPNYPLERTRHMIDMAELDAIYAEEKYIEKLHLILKNLKKKPIIILPDSNLKEHSLDYSIIVNKQYLQSCEPIRNLPEVSGNGIAYILFTSGSTGSPKGVPITHSNVSHFLKYNKAKYEISNKDKFSQTFDQTFDLSVFDIFLAWSSGACVCSIPSIQLLAPINYINEKEINIWFSVPSMANMMAQNGLLKEGCLSGLRLSLFCGEALHSYIVENWQKAAPNSKIENLYGPTELTIACSAYTWDPIRSPKDCYNGFVPIGKVYDKHDSILVDDNLSDVKDGDGGELCIAGPQRFPGYLNDVEKTKEKTLNRKMTNGEIISYYRTGDLVKRDYSGNYLFLGRIDNQIKYIGYRIELGEIDAAFLREESITNAVAVGWPIADGVVRGITVLVTGKNINLKLLRDNVSKFLPRYMMPTEIIIIDAIPLNQNGKVDRKQLYELLENKAGLGDKNG